MNFLWRRVDRPIQCEVVGGQKNWPKVDKACSKSLERCHVLLNGRSSNVCLCVLCGEGRGRKTEVCCVVVKLSVQLWGPQPLK